MGITCTNQTPCGDIYQPPSRANMSLFSIIEIVIMVVVAVLCLVELCDVLPNEKFRDIIPFLIIIDDVLIVAAVCYLLYGLFFAASSRNIRIGIFLFIAGAVLAMVVIVLQINRSSKDIWYKIFQFIILLFLTFILWQQASRL